MSYDMLRYDEIRDDALRCDTYGLNLPTDPPAWRRQTSAYVGNALSLFPGGLFDFAVRIQNRERHLYMYIYIYGSFYFD